MIFREKWDHLASKRSDVCLPHSSDLTNHRNRALNYQKVCRFLCSRSPNTCLFLKINSSCAGGFNVNFNVGVHEQQKKSENVYLLMFSPCFIFYVAFSLLFPVKMLIWIETSHGQSMFCFLKVWLLIGCLVFFFWIRAISTASEFQICWHEGFYCFKCYLYFLCTKWIN